MTNVYYIKHDVKKILIFKDEQKYTFMYILK